MANPDRPPAAAIADGLFEVSADGVQLIGSRCAACGTVAFPAQRSCAKCTSTEVGRYLLPGRGRLWTWTVQRFRPKSPPYLGPEEFEDYGVGYVELPDACRVEAILTTTDPDELRIGREMELTLIPAIGRDGATVQTFAFSPVD